MTAEHAALPGPGELLDALPVAVVLLDGKRCVTGWNRAAEVLYGHPERDVLGEDAVEVLFEVEDRAGAARLLSEATAGRPWSGDRRVRRSDGVLLVSSFRATPLGDEGSVAWIATDGMDQGLAEQEREILLSAEHAARATAEEALGLVEAIISSVPVGIAVFGLDLRYTRVNDAYAALSGVPAADHVGGRLGEVVPLPAQVGADLRRVVTTGRTILGRSVDLRGDGPEDVRSFTVSYFPIRSTSGSLVGAGAAVIDVTETRRAEAERAELLLRAQVAQDRLAILATASTVLTTTMDLDELLDRLAQVLTPDAADWCVIELLDPLGAAEHVAVSHRDRSRADEVAALIRRNRLDTDGRGAVADVFRSGQARLVTPGSAGAVLHGAASDRGQPASAGSFEVHSSVIVPIEAHGHTLGVLLLSTEGDRTLGDDDLDLAVELGHRAALAVENARAFQQKHRISESLQRALLPSTVPLLPAIDVAVRYVAATDGASIGGDWYDVMALDDGRVGLVVGDVVGHDIAASTSMGQVRIALRACAAEDPGRPAAALARVDRLFGALDLTYATCIFAVLDTSAGVLRWSNAGHPPPLLLRGGEATYLDEGGGVLLGVTEGAGVEEATTEVREGDLLVLYTDGLIERRGESLTDGLERLAATAAGLEVTEPEAVCDRILAEMVPPSLERDDDVALLVVSVGATDPAEDGHRLELRAEPQSAALARGFAAGVLEAGGWHDAVDTAALLVTELVTNALRHGRPPYALVVKVSDEEVEVRVHDGDPSVPSPRAPEGLAEGGRGLLLVDVLATAWGTRPGVAGKATWFSLRRPTRDA